MKTLFDVVIIGGGPAAISAAIYSARKKIKTALITRNFGGQLLGSSDVDNYLGLPGLSGLEISDKYYEHLEKYASDIHIVEGEKVLSYARDSRELAIVTNKNLYHTKNIIIATGRTPRKLNVPGEEKFASKGVVYCATCDAPVFFGQDVLVAGGGNSALDAVIQLLEYADKIYLVDVAEKLIADTILIEKIIHNPKVEIISNATVLEIKGDNFVSSVLIRKGRTKREIPVSGVFIEIGSKANCDFVSENVEKTNRGDIVVNTMCKTSEEHVFAAGDVTNIFGKQAIVAAGEGAKAALAVYEDLKRG